MCPKTRQCVACEEIFAGDDADMLGSQDSSGFVCSSCKRLAEHEDVIPEGEANDHVCPTCYHCDEDLSPWWPEEGTTADVECPICHGITEIICNADGDCTNEPKAPPPEDLSLTAA